MNKFQQLLQILVKQFTRNMNRGPNTSFEWMELQNEAVRMLNKTKGVPQTPPKSPFPGWNPRVVEGGKKPAEGIGELLESGKITLGKTPKTTKITLDSKKDRHILLRDADEDIARIKRENKEAVDRWNKKFGKKDKSNPFEDIKPKGDPDWDPDPSGMASGGLAPLMGEGGRPGYSNGKFIYGVPQQDEKTIDDIIKEKALAKTNELQSIEAAKVLAAKKERWNDVLEYDSGNKQKSDRHFFSMMRANSPKKIRKLLNTTLAQLNLIYPDKKPETIDDVKKLISKAAVEGELKGEILGNVLTLTKVLDAAQESTKIDVKSPILNIKGDIDQNRYDISKDLKFTVGSLFKKKPIEERAQKPDMMDMREKRDFDLALKTTFDEGKQTKSKYKLETPKFKYKDLETQLALERDENKYNTSNLLKLAADYDMGNLKLGVTGELEKDKHGVTSKVIPKINYSVPIKDGILSASASKNIIEGGDSNALLSYVYGDKGNPAEQDNFFRLSAEVNPIEGEKKAFIAIKRILEPEPKYLFSKAAGGIMQVEREGFAKGPMDPSKRNFIKIFGGLMAAIPLAKWMKFGPKAKKLSLEVMKHVKGIGMPKWYHQLVNRVIKEGTDVTKILGRVEREVVHTKPISKTEEVTVYRNLDNGDSHVEYGPRIFDENGKVVRSSDDLGTVHLEHKAGEIIEEGKHAGKKTKGEFSAVESEPKYVATGPDDAEVVWDLDNVVGNVDDLTTDTSKLKEFATKKKLTHREKVKAKKKQKYREQLESDTTTQVDYSSNKYGEGDWDDALEELADIDELP